MLNTLEGILDELTELSSQTPDSDGCISVPIHQLQKCIEKIQNELDEHYQYWTEYSGAYIRQVYPDKELPPR